jgi:hypothetical protein
MWNETRAEEPSDNADSGEVKISYSSSYDMTVSVRANMNQPFLHCYIDTAV